MAEQVQVKDKIEPERIIKVSRFRKDIRKTTAHKHNNYFEIIYLSQGSGFHYIDSRRFDVAPPVMYFIRREQVHYWELDEEPEGFVIIIKKSFIDKSLDSELNLLFAKLSRQNSLHVKEIAAIHKILEMLTEENEVDGEYTLHFIEGLLKALLSKVLQVAKPVINKTELKTDLYQSFLSLLNAAQLVKNSVQFYAAQLKTSPQNLNATCRRAVNQSAAEVLAGFIISEAKRLLLYTNNTVSEIAFSLDFVDASHFVKYFKRITGRTPQTFRMSGE